MSAYLLTATLDYLREQFTKPEVMTLDAYGGQFSAAEIDMLSFTAPAILVTVLGWKDTHDSERLTGRNVRAVRMAAFVVYKHATRTKRMAGAMALADRLGTALRLWMPARDDLPVAIGALEAEPTCENLYGRAVDDKGLALWLVEWEQAVKPLVPLPELYELLTIEIIDNTRQGVVPQTVDPTGTLIVTEEVDFAPLPPAL